MSVFITKSNHLKSQIEADNNSECNSMNVRKYLRRYKVCGGEQDKWRWRSPANVLCAMVPGQPGS